MLVMIVDSLNGILSKHCKSRELQGLTVKLENSLCYKYNFLHFHEQL